MPESANIANGVRQQQQRHDEAASIYLDLLQRLPEQDSHPEVIRILSNLASVRQAQGRHEEAMELLQRVLVVREQTFGTDNPRTLATMRSLIRLLVETSQHEQAIELALAYDARVHPQFDDENEQALTAAELLEAIIGEVAQDADESQ